MNDDPFDISRWADSTDAPKESDLPRHDPKGYSESYSDDGSVVITIHPSPAARMMAATIAGQFQALLDTRVFNREEALKIILKTMSAVVIHTGSDEDENE